MSLGQYERDHIEAIVKLAVAQSREEFRKDIQSAIATAISDHIKETELGHYRLGAKVAGLVVGSGVFGGLLGAKLGVLFTKLGEALSRAS